jgi:hypothetical protein
MVISRDVQMPHPLKSLYVKSSTSLPTPSLTNTLSTTSLLGLFVSLRRLSGNGVGDWPKVRQHVRETNQQTTSCHSNETRGDDLYGLL